MQLALATWHEVEEYLQTSRGIIVPVGSTEQHGPNGLIGTDHLDAEFIAKGVGAVSYTHLDVYKRQGRDGRGRAVPGDQGCAGEAGPGRRA